MSKRILIITRSFDHQVGGVETHTEQLVNFLLEKGFSITILTPELGLSKPVFNTSANIIRISKKPWSLLKYSIPFWLGTRKFVRENADLYAAILNISMAGAFLDKKSMSHSKLVTIFHGTYLMERDGLIHRYRKNYFDIIALLGTVYCFFMKYIQKRIMRISDSIFAVSELVNESLQKLLPTESHKIRVLNNFVDTKIFSYIEKDFSKKELNFIYIGRLHREKGLDLLLRASENLKINLKIVGGGPHADSIKKLAGSIDKIEFVPSLSNDKIPELLQAADVFIFPSQILSEGLPISVLEALSCGCVLIASNIPSMKKIITDHKNALLFESGNANDLQKKMSECINDRNLCRSLSHAGRSLVMEKYSREKNLESLLDKLNSND